MAVFINGFHIVNLITGRPCLVPNVLCWPPGQSYPASSSVILRFSHEKHFTATAQNGSIVRTAIYNATWREREKKKKGREQKENKTNLKRLLLLSWEISPGFFLSQKWKRKEVRIKRYKKRGWINIEQFMSKCSTYSNTYHGFCVFKLSSMEF